MRGKVAKQIRNLIPYHDGDQPAKTRISEIPFMGKILNFHQRQASSWRRRYRIAKKLYIRGYLSLE